MVTVGTSRAVTRGSSAVAVVARVVLFVALLAGCGDDGPARADEPVADTAAPSGAAAVCAVLRTARNERTASINATVRDIQVLSPAERYAVLAGGFDSMRALVVDFGAGLDDEPAYNALGDGAAVRAQLGDGVARAVAELDDEQQRFVAEVGAAAAVADADVQGRVGQLFNSVEKTNGELRLDVVALGDATLLEAFRIPDCTHVTDVPPARS